MISIVSPVYRAEKILPTLVAEIHRVMQKIAEPYEIILVDDRSPDNSWEVMKALSTESENLKVYRLSRNFGQHATITAGLTKAKGDWVVVMDCDMQDQPKEIEKFYNKVKEGYDVVLGQRVDRVDKNTKKLGSVLFYKVFNYLTEMDIDNQVSNFGIYHKKVIKSILEVGDYVKAFSLFVRWVGFNKTEIPIEHSSRLEGKSTYTFTKLLSSAFNIILSFSDKPLRMFIIGGGVISLLSLFVGSFYLLKYIFGTITEPGFTSLILSIWFLSGIIISCLGMVGLYVSKTFSQVKGRPVFIIDEEF
ncbi:glycosyltransferase family 2 protein [Riemerella anatipestifer]|nr:glycosyltransferase family 2 protein [Riemerella anatipestifer]MDY3325302.1 glycosyltransferase family 2 protein [Riemerella anatipestifer]MDY3352708.1 glycosyltransferase family 2 protein [Riemerella anatipestifer]